MIPAANVPAISPMEPGEEAGETAVRDKERQFVQQIQPLLEKHCLDCHNDDEAEGDFSLESYRTAADLLDYRNTFLKVLARIETEEMPPEDANEMTSAERRQLSGWLDDHLNNIDCSQVKNPGAVTIRRLTRFEYRNTIRDLVGVDYAPADEFPADDVGYGFDNIGDVLSLPPLLMEKYMAAAESIALEAIDADAFGKPLDRTIRGADFGTSRNANPLNGSELVLFSNGTVRKSIQIETGGRYEIRVMAYGQQAGNEPTKMAIGVDGSEIRELRVRATQENPTPYVVRTRLGSGDRRLEISFTNDFYDPDNARRDQRDRNLVVQSVTVTGPLDHEPKLSESHRSIIFVRPDDETSLELATEEVIIRLASRAFRRPATEDEIERLSSLVQLVMEDGGTFEQGVQLALQAVLVSPHFLYKVEQPGDDPTRDKLLSDYELATSLSYFLWSSMPDDDLFFEAWDNPLREDGRLENQVRRMLKDPRAGALVTNFASQWLQLRLLDDVQPDPDRFAGFDRELRDAMREETIQFVAEIVREDRSILELFDADFTFVNERLASHYGIPNVRGDRFRRVTLGGTRRGGLLTQASILTVTSNPTRTSPVKRGKWILENLMGEPPPPPAPDVMELEDQQRLTGTLREKMQQHRENPSCAACHARMDPLGFALENFDGIGRWRTTDGGRDIDASGELPSGERFDGPVELRQVLMRVKRDQMVRNLAEKMLTYALGRGLEYYDQCAIDKIVEQVEADNYRMSSLILAIVRSEPFQKRRPQIATGD